MIGILEAGAPPAGLAEQWGSYGDMLGALLGPELPARVFDAQAAPLPDPAACRGWLISGSPAAAYDSDDWSGALRSFILKVPETAPLVGICFGHQLMAQAYGGTVAKGPCLALGLQEYRIIDRAEWMEGAGESLRLPASHQDQVQSIGPDAHLLAGNAFNRFGMLSYRGRRAMSLQLHPEFEPGFAAALVELRRGKMGDAAADEAAASLQQPNDRERVAGWIRAFIGPEA